jgi:trk system potassium uptake protein TrkH
MLLAALLHEAVTPFLFSATITLLLGTLFFLISKKRINDLSVQRKDAYLTVSVSWIVISTVGSLPFLFSGEVPEVVDAVFESVSGFTTTGSSILPDIESLPKSLLFWRSFTHWIGGIGIVVLVIVVMPAFRMGGYHLFTLESSLQEKILPKIKSVGIRLLLIYVVLTIVETVLLWVGEMDLFESVCHAFGTVATGGFSPKNTSIADYSAYSQYVIMIFMVLAGTNFVIHYFVVKGQFRKIRKNEEFVFYFVVILALGIILSTTLIVKMHYNVELAFREAFFQLISIVTCTGYATADYLHWPVYAWMIIFFAMFLGGSTGSTAGGIKMVRHLVLFKNLSRIFKQLLSPNAILPVRLNGKTLKEPANRSIISFIVIYLMVLAVGSLILMALGLDVKTAGSASATCMAGIGPGLGTVGPASNFAHLPALAKSVLIVLMLFGRLEIYTLLILFTRNFWRQ